MELIKKYFPSVTAYQREQLESLLPIYAEWNGKINLISRKDFDHFYERHILHSLAIAKFIQFEPKTKVMDAGTGGGFPGIPLAIIFPKTQFTLVDSIGKKIMVVKKVSEALQITNVNAIKERVESVNETFDFIISRAVTSLPVFVEWTKGKLQQQGHCNRANGIIYLKGGDITQELMALPKELDVRGYHLNQWFDEAFFESKILVHIF